MYGAFNFFALDTYYEEIENEVLMVDDVHVDAIIASDGGVIQRLERLLHT